MGETHRSAGGIRAEAYTAAASMLGRPFRLAETVPAERRTKKGLLWRSPQGELARLTVSLLVGEAAPHIWRIAINDVTGLWRPPAPVLRELGLAEDAPRSLRSLELVCIDDETTLAAAWLTSVFMEAELATMQRRSPVWPPAPTAVWQHTKFNSDGTEVDLPFLAEAATCGDLRLWTASARRELHRLENARLVAARERDEQDGGGALHAAATEIGVGRRERFYPARRHGVQRGGLG